MTHVSASGLCKAVPANNIHQFTLSESYCSSTTEIGTTCKGKQE